MDNIDKPVVIPERMKDGTSSKRSHEAPEFVRNVMGSSAGAGSGEFHVYRHLRRKEYARQRFIEEQAKKEDADKAFDERLQQHKREAEERTNRKRLKRLKKKQKAKTIRAKKSKTDGQNESSSDGDDEDSKDDNNDAPGTTQQEPEPQDEGKESCDIPSATVAT